MQCLHVRNTKCFRFLGQHFGYHISDIVLDIRKGFQIVLTLRLTGLTFDVNFEHRIT